MIDNHPENLPAELDRTHRADAVSWVAGAADHAQFPIQNLPLGIFAVGKSGAGLAGVAIGDWVLDLSAVADAGLLDGDAAHAVTLARGGTLNRLMAAPAFYRRALRFAVFDLLHERSPQRAAIEEAGGRMLHRAERCRMLLPAAIGDYTDFNAGIHHARKAGQLFRPDNPLLPAYKHVPLAYHGRASTVRAAGGEVFRPRGQVVAPGANGPELRPSDKLDYEFEMGIWLGAIPDRAGFAQAIEGISGFCLVNDWSARDIQRWEGQPLGPFLAKNFATTISPWIVTPEALAPFRIAQPARPDGDPRPLPYLWDAGDQARGAIAATLTLMLRTRAMSEAGLPAETVSTASASDLYWTPAQMAVHHGVNGCVLRPGDLIGTGTISSAAATGGGGCLLELTADGTRPMRLGNGEERTYLEDGDEVTLRGICTAPGFRSIGFGDCRDRVVAA